MELTPGYYRHFKDAVAPITRGNPSGKGEMPSRRKPLSRFIGRRSGTELNIERCKRMIAEGRMTEAGLKVMPHERGKMNSNKIKI